MLRALLLAPFLLVLIAFVLSNPQPVTLAMWPTDLTLEAPLSIATLVIAGVFFLLGAIMVWLPGLGHRRRAHRAEKRARGLGCRAGRARQGGSDGHHRAAPGRTAGDRRPPRRIRSWWPVSRYAA